MARHEGSAPGGLSVVPPAACGCGPRPRARPTSLPAAGPARHTNFGKLGSLAEKIAAFFCNLVRRASRNSTATALRSELGHEVINTVTGAPTLDSLRRSWPPTGHGRGLETRTRSCAAAPRCEGPEREDGRQHHRRRRRGSACRDSEEQAKAFDGEQVGGACGALRHRLLC